MSTSPSEQSQPKQLHPLIAALHNSLRDENGELTALGHDVEKCRAILNDVAFSDFVKLRCRCLLAALEPDANIESIAQSNQCSQRLVKDCLECFVNKGFAGLEHGKGFSKYEADIMLTFLHAILDENGELTAIGRDLEKCREAIASTDDSVSEDVKRRSRLVLAAAEPKASPVSLVAASGMAFPDSLEWVKRFATEGFAGLSSRPTNSSSLIKNFIKALHDENGELTAIGRDLEKCREYVNSEGADPSKVKRCKMLLAFAESGASKTIDQVLQEVGLATSHIRWIRRYMQFGFAGLEDKRVGMRTDPEVLSEFVSSLRNANGELTQAGRDIKLCRQSLHDSGLSEMQRNRCLCILAAIKPNATFGSISKASNLFPQEIRDLLRLYMSKGFEAIKPIKKNSFANIVKELMDSLHDESGNLTDNGRDLEKCRAYLIAEDSNPSIKKRCQCVLFVVDHNGEVSLNQVVKQNYLTKSNISPWLQRYTEHGFNGIARIASNAARGLATVRDPAPLKLRNLCPEHRDFLRSLRDSNLVLTDNGRDLEKCKAALTDSTVGSGVKNRCRGILAAANPDNNLSQIAKACSNSTAIAKLCLKLYTEFGFAGLQTDIFAAHRNVAFPSRQP